jgi:hypothetical protein
VFGALIVGAVLCVTRGCVGFNMSFRYSESSMFSLSIQIHAADPVEFARVEITACPCLWSLFTNDTDFIVAY